MASIDYQTRLAQVQAAIAAILIGKMESYELDGQRVTYLDLDRLQKEENRLISHINRRARRGGAFGVMVPR